MDRQALSASRRQAGLIVGAAATGLLSALTRPALAVDDRRDLMEFDPKRFTRAAVVDNPWMPLPAGKQLVYEGSQVEDGKRIPHRVYFTVTDLNKDINGVPAVVVLEQDLSRGKLEEQELVFFSQDDSGNVWHLGQIRETYDTDGGEFVGTRAWMVGHLNGAHAGIMMQANPKVGVPSYSQGFAPTPFNWTDRARVRSLTETTKVPAGEFSPVLVTEEFDQEYPNAVQLKYYARGIGTVRVGYTGNDPQQEVLELVRVNTLSADEMAAARAEVAALEERAYVYATTKPAYRRPG
jgi:hypothetical protein